MQTEFFNTTNLSAEERQRAAAQAKHQSRVVLDIYCQYARSELTPSEVLAYAIKQGKLHKRTPITSVRRAISTLTKSGQLIKTKTQRKGPLGAKEYCWCLHEKDEKK